MTPPQEPDPKPDNIEETAPLDEALSSAKVDKPSRKSENIRLI